MVYSDYMYIWQSLINKYINWTTGAMFNTHEVLHNCSINFKILSVIAISFYAMELVTQVRQCKNKGMGGT